MTSANTPDENLAYLSNHMGALNDRMGVKLVEVTEEMALVVVSVVMA